MVRILSNGEIVPDDDPRVQGQSRPPTNTSSSSGSAGPRQRQSQAHGQIRHDGDQQPQYRQVSVFDGLNQRLLDAGVPRWHLGSYVIEPIVSAGFLLALLLMGFRGLLFAGLLFFVVKYSSQGSPGAVLQTANPFSSGGGQHPPGGSQRGGGSSSWSSGGQRLGR